MIRLTSLVLFLTILFNGCKHNSNDDNVNENNPVDNPAKDFTSIDTPENEDTTNSDYANNSLIVGLKIKDKFGVVSTTFSIDEEVVFELTVTNNEDHPIWYRATWPAHDILVKQDNNSIWSKFHGKLFPQFVTEDKIESGEVIDLSAIWNGKNNKGETISTGNYLVVPYLAFFVRNGEVEMAESIEIVMN